MCSTPRVGDMQPYSQIFCRPEKIYQEQMFKSSFCLGIISKENKVFHINSRSRILKKISFAALKLHFQVQLAYFSQSQKITIQTKSQSASGNKNRNWKPKFKILLKVKYGTCFRGLWVIAVTMKTTSREKSAAPLSAKLRITMRGWAGANNIEPVFFV